MAVFDVNALSAELGATGQSYLEFIRQSSLSMGLYELKAGQPDLQEPHTEDETYLVMKGRARFKQGDEEFEVGPGTVIYVPANVEHRFFDIKEDLSAMVFFAPAEQSKRATDEGVDATG